MNSNLKKKYNEIKKYGILVPNINDLSLTPISQFSTFFLEKAGSAYFCKTKENRLPQSRKYFFGRRKPVLRIF